jgi:hypothetical protein
MRRAKAKELLRLDAYARAKYRNINNKSVTSYFRDKRNTEAVRFYQIPRRYYESEIRVSGPVKLSQDKGIPSDIGVNSFGRIDIKADEVTLNLEVLYNDLRRFTTDLKA